MLVRAFQTLRPHYLDANSTGADGTWVTGTEPHTANVKIASGNGLLAEFPLRSLGPWGQATRAEVAQMLSNALGALEDPPGAGFEKSSMDEADVTRVLDEVLSDPTLPDPLPDIYLPAELPEGYAVAKGGRSSRWGGITLSSSSSPRENPSVEGYYCVVTYTDGAHPLGLLLNYRADPGDVPIVDPGVEGVYGPLTMSFVGYGAYVVSVPSDPSSGTSVSVLAYHEDLPVAFALAKSVRLVESADPWQVRMRNELRTHRPTGDIFLPEELPSGFQVGEVPFEMDEGGSAPVIQEENPVYVESGIGGRTGYVIFFEDHGPPDSRTTVLWNVDAGLGWDGEPSLLEDMTELDFAFEGYPWYERGGLQIGGVVVNQVGDETSGGTPYEIAVGSTDFSGETHKEFARQMKRYE